MDYIFRATKIIFFCLSFFIVLVSKQEISNNNYINNNNTKFIKDVLFINGCNPKFLPHPYRYRVLHQIEQLNAGFLESDEFFYLNFEPVMIRNYRVIIFFRCPWTKKIGEAISLAKSLNKKVLFDIDDLVIDTKYTDEIQFLKTLPQKQKDLYDDGVRRMGKTLKLCDAAITTTEALADELKHYVPNVFINHNVASEEMWKLSDDALKNKELQKKDEQIIIGYFSGSISHNPDLEMIKPALLKILKEFKNVQLLLLGELTFDNFSKEYLSQINIKKFTDWKKLPAIISNIDINIAPIEYSTFNCAKSENKWVEAALVKVPTIASNYGRFKSVIKHKETGLLCSNINDWYIYLKMLIINEKLRKNIGINAYNTCKEEYNTIYTGKNLVNYINSISNKHIGFFLPSLQISGGIYVVLKHACILKEEGWDVDLIVPQSKKLILKFEGYKFNIISLNKAIMVAEYDIIVATFYSTVFNIINYYRAKKHLYLVQGYETDFYTYGYYFRAIAEKTYSLPFGVKYITISKWCQNWLWEKYKKKSRYAPNGIDIDNISFHKRNLKKNKIRILVEGDSSSFYKNVDESFKIIEKLDNNTFEIWYLSNNGKPKNWYRIDKFFHKIPYKEVHQIYYDCDILLKSSYLESFSYPPLEMMATGGYSIVVPNEGNKEYLIDGQNCLLYESGDIDSAINNIKRLISDDQLQKHLYKNGIRTARKRDWNLLRNQILSLYII